MAEDRKPAEVAAFLRKRMAELTENPDIELQLYDRVPISELGMDSVKTINLIIQMEKHYDILFEDEELTIDYFETIELFAKSILDKLGIQA